MENEVTDEKSISPETSTKQKEEQNEVKDNPSSTQDNIASNNAASSKQEKQESKLTSNPGQPSSSTSNIVYDDLSTFLRQLGIGSNQAEEKHEKVISSLTIEGIADYISKGKCRNIIVMTGAGVSTSAGIPDFRSPGTGLYSKLEKYNLPYPQAIFELAYFKENPEPFFMLAKELYPGNYKPTPCHYFIKLLDKKNILLRNYTQNIDGLEHVAGVTSSNVIAAHGMFRTSHCVTCHKSYKEKWMKDKIFASEIPRCSKCEGLVKPDIVFFGEQLPDRFFSHMGKDFRKADLLIVMGTSLTVQPFASLINRVGEHVPRLLINKEKCGQSFFSGGFNFDGENNYRDVVFLGTCDDGCTRLAELLGWKDELEKLIDHQDSESSGADESANL